MSGHDTLRGQHLEHMRALVPAAVERIGWPAERVAEYRTQQLRALLHTAAEGSAWHRDRLAGIDVDALDETGIAALPVMTKDDLMGHFDEIVTDRRPTLDAVERHLEGLTGDAYLFDEFHAIASGGSSGRRGVFVYGWEAWTYAYLGLMRYELRAWKDLAFGPGPVTMAVIAAGRPTHGSNAIFRTFADVDPQLHVLPVSMPVEEIIAALNALQPTVFSGYPSALYVLAGRAQAGDLKIDPARVLTYAEPLLPEIRSRLEATFGRPVCNWWAASETFGVAASCGQGPGMHLNEDLVIVEPVDADGRPVGPGERSDKIYVTTLYNPTLPLIRFELTDEMTLLGKDCPCGSSFRLVADVEGRLDDGFVYDGVTVHPHVFRSALGTRRHIVEYQVHQTERGADIVVCCDGPVDLGAVQAEIVAALSPLIGRPEVAVSAVETIARADTGKLRRFFRRTGPPPGGPAR